MQKRYVGHSVEPRAEIETLQDYPVNLEPRKTEYMRVVTKGGIIRYGNRLFQNIDIPTGAFGLFDLKHLIFHQNDVQKSLAYSVKEVGIHV